MRAIYNVSALTAQNALRANDKKYSDSSIRLSSGKKLNVAKDDPAGLARSRRINAQIQAMKKANNNANDGVNIIKTIDGVLGEVQEMLQRMNELAVRAATDTLQSTDREYIQEEISNLKSEIQRVAGATQFNGQNLLDGNYDRRGYATKGGETDPAIKVTTFSDTMASGVYTITGLTTALLTDNDKKNDAYEDGAKQLDAKATLDNFKNLEVTFKDENGEERTVFKPGISATTVKVTGDQVRIQNDQGESITLQIDEALNGEELKIDLTDMGPLRMQIGVNEGQSLDIKVPPINMNSLGIRFTDCSEADWARTAIGEIENAIDYVSRLRSDLGAKENRLENRISSLNVNEENVTGAYSRIVDADMAKEMTEYSTNQVLSQAGISMLAQANQRPGEVLQLLQ